VLKTLTMLPDTDRLETRAVLKQLVAAHRHLAELKGVTATVPNPEILISTLSLQEAKDSSEIENIFTTQDELYRAEVFGGLVKNRAAKEVLRCAVALKAGFEQIRDDRLITTRRIVDFHRELMVDDTGIRRRPGTVIKNQATGEIVYTPPQDANEIKSLLGDLERFVNENSFCAVDPLVKMAIAHHQFESIHPFYDGNGRAGRILNSLYLVATGLLDLPVLYLSGYINAARPDYYRLLQSTHVAGDWEPWLLYIIRGIAITSANTIVRIQKIRKLMRDYEEHMRAELPKIYSQALLKNLFRHPYTTIEAVQNDLEISRLTASKYLSELTIRGFLE
jgi:Fic family protein